ncbi:MAG: hypothetical protein ACKVSF_10520 [Alphaproteobacteria bacterium]
MSSGVISGSASGADARLSALSVADARLRSTRARLGALAGAFALAYIALGGRIVELLIISGIRP